MGEQINTEKLNEAEGVRYDTMIGARYTQEKLLRLKSMAKAAGKIFPDYMRALIDKAIDEDDLRLGDT
jgi:hypothetical protein